MIDRSSTRYGPPVPIHRVAVTTRETFGHIPKPQVVDVDVMSSDEAVELLISSARARNPADGRLAQAPQATRRLAELCDHLPLALQIVAALLADEPDRPIVELVEELASEEDRLNSLEYDTDLSVRAAFALSYKRLPDNLKRLFRLLSVVPGGDVGLVDGRLADIRIAHCGAATTDGIGPQSPHPAARAQPLEHARPDPPVLGGVVGASSPRMLSARSRKSLCGTS